MLRNYFKIALRTLRKNKLLSSINIGGLAAGIATTLLIFLFVLDEFKYDRHHDNAARIYRVVKDFINDDGSRIPDATSPGPLAAAMQRDIPEMESVTRIHPDWGGTVTMEYDGRKFSEPKVWRVDSSFFDVFTVPFLRGDNKTALADINSVVLTETAARRYFGDDDPIGKILRMDGRDDVTVSAVVADVPPQSHFHYDFLLSYRRLPAQANTNWANYNYYTYVKVREGTDVKAFEKKIQQAHDKNTTEHYSEFYVQPLTDIHLTSKLKWELEANGDRLYVYIFILIGVFILMIAAINYVNLSTAKSSQRAKETGIRKVSGAERTSLMFQFLIESILTCFIASLLAIAFAYALMPTVNELTQKSLDLQSNPMVIGYLFVVTLFIGVIAGIFPAAYLSSFRPVAVLKGFKLNEKGALNLRKSLVVVQFTISIALIIGALVIVQQIRFLRSANLGFDKDQVVVLQNARGLSKSDRSSFLNTLHSLPGVKIAATSGTILGQGFNTTRLRAVGAQQQQQLNFSSVDFDYLDVVGIQIKEGRSFSKNFPADSLNNGIFGGPLNQRLGGIIINERAAKEFGFGDSAVGQKLIWATDADTVYHVEVVGVAKDFHFTSMRNEIKPYGFLIFSGGQSNFTVKLAGGDIRHTVATIEEKWKQAFPERPFEYVFLDDTFEKMYTAEARFEKVFISMVVLGILIACLGLFALATFSAEQRIKEIGIRKVLGASVSQIVVLVSTDFVKLVAIAIIIAIPIGFYAINLWLEGFAYRITVKWWVFAVAALLALIIAFLTISSQAIRAARSNPAKSLRSE
jgi:putative ABC transport system permease protein